MPTQQDSDVSGDSAPAPPPGGLFRTVKARQRLLAGVLLAGAGVLGYLLTVVLYPAPIMAGDRPAPRVLGLALTAARDELAKDDFRVRVEEAVPDPVIPAGRIVWQDPPAETMLPRSSTIRITPSAGPATVPVPDLAQFDLDQARQVIDAAGLRIGQVDTIVSRTPAGVVVGTRPVSGSMRSPGSSVDLVVSRGPADIRVPSVVGLRQEEARQRLEALGLRVGTVRMQQSGSAQGVVLDQQPSAGILSPRDGRVNLVISGERP